MILFTLIACGLDMNLQARLPGSDTDSTSTPAAEIACGEDEDIFREHVWEPVLGDQCVLCHTAEGAASHTNLILDAQDMIASQRSASALGQRLLDKPSGALDEGHSGGALVFAGSADWEALEFWIDWTEGVCEVPEAEVCEDGPSDRLLRRLSHGEYDATASDLLALEVTAATGFAPDTVVDGHANDAHALQVQALLADQYRAAAEALAWEFDLDAQLGCDPWAEGQKACATRFVEDFGTRAFRRPITQEELDRYMAFWEAVAIDEGFDEAARWVVAAMLQSPNFLYRPELGELGDDGLYHLTDWEIASELSYAILGTMPDAELLRAAEAGELSTDAQIAAQAGRLLALPAATGTTRDLVTLWLQLDRIDTVSREGLEDADRAAMAAEVEAFLDDHADGELDELMAGGLLSERAVLTVHALPDGSSPIHRGVLVRERLLCEELPEPPANLDTSPPETDPDKSTRERYAEHSSNPECSGCHERIDPIGFGFEHFDQLGNYRETDSGHAVDASGELDGVSFVGVDELSSALSDDPRFRSCFMQTWRRHLSGTEACAEDPGVVGLDEPLEEFTTRLAFTTRVGSAGDTPATGARLDLDDLPEDEVAYGAITWEMTSDDWSTGWCGYVTVTNESSEGVSGWQVELDPDGTIGSHFWSSELDEQGEVWVFTPEDWNADLAAGASIEFGFCAAR